MECVIRHKIVKVLETDGNLLLNWAMFYDGLKLKVSDYLSLNDQFKRGVLTNYQLFLEILNLWVSASSELDSTDKIVQKLIEVLKKNDYNLLVGKLKTAFEIPTQIHAEKKVPIWFEVGKPTRNFVGRRDELEQLKELFNNPDELVVTITGMGGVGKSELAKNFAKQSKVSADCIWLNGESGESLKNSINRLENFVNLQKSKETENTLDVLFARVISSIRGNIRTVVIIDNVDDANENVQKLISKTPEGHCFFLITSQNVSVLDYAGSIIKLATLSDEAAINLLRKSGIDEPDDEILKLCFLLGNFPLALHQATAFIKMQQHTGDEAYNISDYLKNYEAQKRCVLGHKLNQIEHDYKKTTLITWNICFQKIQQGEKFGDLAIQLLNTIAYFEPDEIEVEFLNLYQQDLVRAIPLVKTYSLVKFENGVISIHRLTQQVIRLNLAAKELDIPQLVKIIASLEPILETAEQFVGLHGCFIAAGYIEKEGRSLKHIENGMCHIVSVLKYAIKHTELLHNFKHVFLDTLNNLRYFWLYQHIIDLCHATLDQTKTGCSKAKFTLRIGSELAYAQCILDKKFNQSNLLELKNVYTEQLSILGEEDESALTTAHYIAATEEIYSYAFRDEVKAENLQWCRNVMELKTKVFGPLHKSTLSTKFILVKYLCSVGRNYDKAVKLQEECFEWQQTQLGAEGSGTYWIFKNYINCLLKTDNFEKARYVVEQHLRLGLTRSKHNVYKDLSLVLFCLGKTQEAFHNLRQAVSINDIGGEISEFHFDMSKYEDADILLKDGDYSEALIIYKSIFIRVLEYNCDWWVADSEYKMSQCLIGLQCLKQAQEFLQNALFGQRFWLGNNSKPATEMRKLLDDVNKKIAAD